MNKKAGTTELIMVGLIMLVFVMFVSGCGGASGENIGFENPAVTYDQTLDQTPAEVNAAAYDQQPAAQDNSDSPAPGDILPESDGSTADFDSQEDLTNYIQQYVSVTPEGYPLENTQNQAQEGNTAEVIESNDVTSEYRSSSESEKPDSDSSTTSEISYARAGTTESTRAAVTRIIDNANGQKAGPSAYWRTVTGVGVNGDMTWTYVNGNSTMNYMVWRSGLLSGRYEVSVFIPRNYATTMNAKYRVQYLIGNNWRVIREIAVNQYRNTDRWVSLGAYDFPGEPAVFLGDNTGEKYVNSSSPRVGFDAVKFVDQSSCSTSSQATSYRPPLDTWPNTGGYRSFGAKVGYAYHNGADFKSTVGSKVYAVLDGVIIHTQEAAGFGSLNPSSPGGVIVIRHPDNRGGTFYAVYGHLYRDTSLQQGMRVDRGKEIGTIRPFYNKGEFLPHLHFGIYTGRSFPVNNWGYSYNLDYWRNPKPSLDSLPFSRGTN